MSEEGPFDRKDHEEARRMLEADQQAPACANPKCLNGANCPGHPWAEDELAELRTLEAGSRDMNDAAYKGAGFRQARRFFVARVRERPERPDGS